MAYVKEDFVIDRMLERNCMIYKMLDGNRLIDENDDEDMPIEKAVNQLTASLASIDSGIVTVKLSNKTGKNKALGGRDYKNYEFQVKLGGRAVAVSGVSTDSQVVNLLKEISALKTEIVVKEYQSKLDKLQESIDAIKNDKTNPYIEKFLPVIAGMFGVPLGGGNSTALAGAPVVNSEKKIVSLEDKARLRAALDMWITADPENHLEVIEMCATLASTKPSAYASAIPLLKSQL